MAYVKPASRPKVQNFIRKNLGEKWFQRTTEEFYGQKKGTGIWTTNEDTHDYLGGGYIYDYYGSYGPQGANQKFEEELKKMGWYIELYDGGTVMLYPN